MTLIISPPLEKKFSAVSCVQLPNRMIALLSGIHQILAIPNLISFYNPETGLIVFEVKDWTIDQICEVNPKTFKIRSRFTCWNAFAMTASLSTKTALPKENQRSPSLTA
jgi:hypothetical protein